MKKIAKRTTKRTDKKLRLSSETVKALTTDQLTQAASGCDMTTWTTVQGANSGAC